MFVPGHGRPIKETTDVIVLDSMLVDEVVLEDDQPTPTQDEADLDAPSATTTPPVATQEAVARLLRDTSRSPDEVESANGTSELTRRRRSERISARNVTSDFICLVEVIREPLTVRSPTVASMEVLGGRHPERDQGLGRKRYLHSGRPSSWCTHSRQYCAVSHQDRAYRGNCAV